MILLERDDDVEALEERLQLAHEGAGQLVVLVGEAGIGKTTLVRTFVDAARSVKVLTGACDPLATPRPLGPLLDMAPALDVDVRLPAAGGAVREALLDRFQDELAARSRTSLVVLEDVHWADDATLDLLRHVGRRLTSLRALLLVTVRSDDLTASHPVRVALGDLATAPGVSRRELRPLSRDAVARLATALEVDDADVDAVHQATGGNPFLVTEALTSPRPGGVPMSVRDAIVARTARLPDPVRRVVEATSIIPTRAETWLAAALAEVAPGQVDAAVSAGLLRDDRPGTVAFRHDLARHAVEQDLLPAHRSALHAVAVERLLDRYGDETDPARIAHHAEHAGDAATARTFAVRAARRAVELGARREATEQWERALRHAEGIATEELAELWEGYARAVGQVDRPRDMRAATERLVEIRREFGDPIALGDALFGHSIAAWHAGDAEATLRAAREAVEVLERTDPTPQLADARAHVGSVLMVLRRLDEVDRWVRPAIELATELGADRAVARALNTLGTARLAQGDVDGAADLERSIEIAGSIGLDDHVVLGFMNLGAGAGEGRLYGLAEPALERGIELAEEGDIPGYVHYNTAWLARVRFEQGAWQDAEQLLRRVPLDEPGDDVQYRLVAVGVRARLRARQGSDVRRAELEAAWDLVSGSQDLPRRWHLAATRAEVAWLVGEEVAGEQDRIATALADTYELALERRLSWAVGELGLWRWRAGLTADLPEVAAAPYALHVAGRCREAAAVWETIGCPYEAADALADSDDAEDLRRALDGFLALGAEPMAARVRRRLRRRGVRDVPIGPQPATAANPAGLTPRQAEVLTLLDQGLTDAEIAERLFISPKTAGHHVSAILGKLGARSRTQAARLARDHGLLEGRPGA